MESYPEIIARHQLLIGRETELWGCLDEVRAQKKRLESDDWGEVDLLANELPEVARWLEYRLTQTPPEQRQRPFYHQPLMELMGNACKYAGQAGLLIQADVEQNFRKPAKHHIFVLPKKPSISATDEAVKIPLSDELPVNYRHQEHELEELSLLCDALPGSDSVINGRWSYRKTDIIWGTNAVIKWSINEGKSLCLLRDFRGMPQRRLNFSSIFNFLAKHNLLNEAMKDKLDKQADDILQAMNPYYDRAQQSYDWALERKSSYKKNKLSAAAQHLAEVIFEEVKEEYFELDIDKELWLSIHNSLG